METLTDIIISPQSTENYYEKVLRISDLINACYAILNGVLSPKRRDIERMFGLPPIVNLYIPADSVTRSISQDENAHTIGDDSTSSASNINNGSSRSSRLQVPTFNQPQMEQFSLWMVSLSPLPPSVQHNLLKGRDTLERLEVVVNSFISRFGRSVLDYDDEINRQSGGSPSSAVSSAVIQGSIDTIAAVVNVIPTSGSSISSNANLQTSPASPTSFVTASDAASDINNSFSDDDNYITPSLTSSTK